LGALVFILVFAGQQCNLSLGRSVQGGLYVSHDDGESWQPSNTVIVGDATSSLGRYSIEDFAFDPKNPSTIFLGTTQAGLYRSSDAGATWAPVTTRGRIQAIAVSPTKPELLAAARVNQIFVSADGGAAWQLVYTNPSQAIVTDIAFDVVKSNDLYASISSGELLSSKDGGKTWSQLTKFEYPINEIYTDAQHQNRLYVRSRRNQILRSDDSGKNWVIITKALQSDFSRVDFIDLALYPKRTDQLLVASSKGLYRSDDAGTNWLPVNLLTQADATQIRAIGWSAQIPTELYYLTQTVFYRSTDLGGTWRTVPFPSSASPVFLFAHPRQSSNLYIGTVTE